VLHIVMQQHAAA